MLKEYYTINNNEIRVQIEDSKIDAIKNKNITYKSVRVFDEEKKILSLASAVGNVPDSELEKKATNLLSLNIPFEYELERDTKGNFKKDKLSIKDSQSLEKFTEKVLNDLKDVSQNFVINGAVYTTRYKKSLKNSLGLDLSSEQTYLVCTLMLKQKGSGNIFDTGAAIYGFDITENQYQNFLNDTKFVTNACLSKEVTLESGKYKILCEDNYLLRKFYSDVMGDEYEEKSSLLTGKLNEKIFHESISINECHNYEKFVTFLPFDDEGIVRKEELVVVDKGVLKSIFYDKKKAKKYGKVSTGNGFRSYNSNPGISPRGFRFIGVEKSAKELIADDLVIIPSISSGGDFLPNGNFSLPIQMAFVFKNGEFIGKAPQITLTGNYLDSFNKDFIAIGKNDILPEALNETLILSNMTVNVN
ncbi:MAG: metallopeptidase TldD-related protein [Candidatus Cloacimonetes bacterium]|nr:metallopeptidase TldD-related protein [Candidatus Cloacimonadota bacterium]